MLLLAMSILLLLCFLLVLYFKQSNFISLIANFPSIYLPDLWLNHGSFGRKYFLFHLCCFFLALKRLGKLEMNESKIRQRKIKQFNSAIFGVHFLCFDIWRQVIHERFDGFPDFLSFFPYRQGRFQGLFFLRHS